ncbi:rod shape-determining protein MreD [Fuchsiella alkaliacetigena]|uniref:rod shape-determining protein MreD n=1 Tax=Fuchsiella alkaliacetigena TaxID=957042 RepID=UPI00200A4DC7|nr:rod shape-determining protein MreD [Fuchsiella alkaliacetigena]MCK8825601.1 rod shape-determining protein MreD [Fuchsiella alkaliacetigena]
MRDLIYILMVIIALILQVAYFSFYPLGGVIPDLLLIIVVILALFNGFRHGAYLGFLAGLLQDLFSGGLFGVNIVSKLLLGYTFGFLKQKIYYRNFAIPVALVILATVIDQLIFVILNNKLAFNLAVWLRLRELLIPLLIYNALLSILIYPVIYYLQRKYLQN